MTLKQLLSLTLLYLLFAACSPTYTRYLKNYQYEHTSEQPDFANLNYWAAHPYKWDPSDSIPAPLRADYRYDSSIDVFFLYPTSYTSNEDPGWNASVNDALINAKTDYNSILFQASAFNEYRVFAPRYRQAHIRSYYTTDTSTALQAFDTAYEDVKNAFIYYLAHFNQGRPVIIASHSQGTTHALRLLKEFFDNSPLQKQLVAAYLVGMYIPEKQFSSLSICETPNQTGCFCGWRTYRINYIPPFVKKETGKEWVTNPLSWQTGDSMVWRENNKGSILRKFNKLIPNVADAQINNGVLWTRKPRFRGSFLLRTKNYHIGDINLYYASIRENLRDRVRKFKSELGNAMTNYE